MKEVVIVLRCALCERQMVEVHIDGTCAAERAGEAKHPHYRCPNDACMAPMDRIAQHHGINKYGMCVMVPGVTMEA